MITISQKTTFTWNRSQGKTKAEHPNGPHFPPQCPNCLKFCTCRTFPVQCPKLVVGVHGKDMLEAVSTQLLPTQPSAGKFAMYKAAVFTHLLETVCQGPAMQVRSWIFNIISQLPRGHFFKIEISSSTRGCRWWNGVQFFSKS